MMPAVAAASALRRIAPLTTIPAGAAWLAATCRDSMPGRRAASLHHGVGRHGAPMEFSGPIEGLTDPTAHGVPLARARAAVWDPAIFAALDEARVKLSGFLGEISPDAIASGTGEHARAHHAVASQIRAAGADFSARLADGRLRLFGWAMPSERWQWITPRTWSHLQQARAGVVYVGEGVSYSDVHVHDTVGLPRDMAVIAYGPDDMVAQLGQLQATGALAHDPENSRWQVYHPEEFTRRECAAGEYELLRSQLAKWLDGKLAVGLIVPAAGDKGLVKFSLPGGERSTEASLTGEKPSRRSARIYRTAYDHDPLEAKRRERAQALAELDPQATRASVVSQVLDEAGLHRKERDTPSKRLASWMKSQALGLTTLRAKSSPPKTRKGIRKTPN